MMETGTKGQTCTVTPEGQTITNVEAGLPADAAQIRAHAIWLTHDNERLRNELAVATKNDASQRIQIEGLTRGLTHAEKALKSARIALFKRVAKLTEAMDFISRL